jgi:hypothetical protein
VIYGTIITYSEKPVSRRPAASKWTFWMGSLTSRGYELSKKKTIRRDRARSPAVDAKLSELFVRSMGEERLPPQSQFALRRCPQSLLAKAPEWVNSNAYGKGTKKPTLHWWHC